MKVSDQPDEPVRTGPLTGVRVVELAGIGPGPFAAMMLADLGADVVRVDRPGGPGLAVAPAERDVLGRGRPSVALDLKSERGVGVVLDLVGRADVLIEGFRPGVMERLGLGPDECLRRNPRLVYGRMTGWGQDGPLAQSAGHDLNYLAVAGGLDPVGPADGAPVFPLNVLGDFGGGALYLVTGVLAALTHARSTGEGQVVDAAIVDGVAHLMSMAVTMQQNHGWDGRRGTNLLGGAAPFYDVYACSDGRYVSVGALEPQFWQALLDVLAAEGIADVPDRNDPAQWPALRSRLADVFGSRPQDAWNDLFDGTDACVAPVASITEAYAHPHLQDRGTYVESRGLTQPAPAPRFSATPATLDRPPSRAGADTREALTAWGVADVEGLLAQGVAIQSD